MTQVEKTGGNLSPDDPVGDGIDHPAAEPVVNGDGEHGRKAKGGRRSKRKKGTRTSVFDLLGKSNDELWEMPMDMHTNGAGPASTTIEESGEEGAPIAGEARPATDAGSVEGATRHTESRAAGHIAGSPASNGTASAVTPATEVTSAETASSAAAPTDASSTATASTDTASTDTASTDTASTDTAPTDTAAVKIEPIKPGRPAVTAAWATLDEGPETVEPVVDAESGDPSEPVGPKVVATTAAPAAAATVATAIAEGRHDEPERSGSDPDEAGSVTGPPDTEAASEDGTPRGLHRVGTGFKEIGTGTTEATRERLEALRPHLPQRAKKLSNRRLGLVVLLVLIVVLALIVAVAASVAAAIGGPTSVVVSTARPAVVHSSPGGVGSLSASPQHVSVVSLNVTGVTAPIEVTGVDVLAGQQVTKGTPLLQLNPVPFQQNILQVQASLTQAQQTLASASASAKGSSGSAGAYLAVQVPTLQGQVAIDQQLLSIAQGNTTSLTAPMTGSVSYIRVAAGQVAQPGASLVQIIDPTTVDVSTGMQLTDLQSVAVGDSATVTPTELPGVHLQGKVLAVSASAANGGLEGTIVVAAANRPNNPIPIGTQAFVTVSAPVLAAVTVPSVAIQNAELNPAVAVVKNGHVTFQPVQLGASDSNRTQILSGLRAGQVVAVSNLQNLNDGDQVKASTSGT